MSMRYGEYQVVITGPQGVVLDAAVGLSGRTLARLALDDEALQELLIVTSVCGGAIQGELETQHRRLSQGVCPATSGRPGDAVDVPAGDQVTTKRPEEGFAPAPAAREMADGRSQMEGGAA